MGDDTLTGIQPIASAAAAELDGESDPAPEAARKPARVEDAIVIGGSYAGLSAALQLARARRNVYVVDAGLRRNRPSHHAHGFLGQDGTDPADIVALGRAELCAYPTVTWIDGRVTAARITTQAPPAGGVAMPRFEVTLAGGEALAAHHLVLAGGVVDELPDLPGLRERFGAGVFHCPYCHGYELECGAIGLVAGSPLVERLAQLLPDWGATTLFAEDVELDAISRTAIAARGVTLEDTRIAALEGDGPGVDVRLVDGRVLSFAGVFVTTRTRLADGLARELGCELDEGSHGEYLKVNGAGETSVRGVYACGDNAGPSGSIATAVGDGARVGVAVHQSLVFR
jgi:thioredoxin reductase